MKFLWYGLEVLHGAMGYAEGHSSYWKVLRVDGTSPQHQSVVLTDS